MHTKDSSYTKEPADWVTSADELESGDDVVMAVVEIDATPHFEGEE